jgi:branched-chain amino acid transport system substrate-binding protein
LRLRLNRSAGAACLVLAGFVALGACGGGSQRAGGREKLNLKIADIVSLSGQQAPLGAPEQKAADLAVAEIRKGITGAKADHTITIVHENDRSEPNAALTSAKRLVQQGASCITGPGNGTQAALVLTGLGLPKGIPLISPSASSDALTTLQKGGKSYLTRTVPPDSVQGPALAALMTSELGGAKGKKVNVAAFKSLYGDRLTKAFTSAWKGRGGKIGATVSYEQNLPTYKPQAKDLVAGKPDAFVFFDFQETYFKIAVELVKTHKWKVNRSFGTDALAVSTLPTAGTAVSEGLRGVAPGSEAQGALGSAFDRLYKSSPEEPKYRQSFDAQNFDAVMLCYLAAVAAGSTKGTDIADWIEKVSAPPGTKYTWQQLPQAIRALQNGDDIDYEGASGPIDMDRYGNPTAGVYDAYRIRKNKMELYGTVAVPPTAQGLVKHKPVLVNPHKPKTPKVPGAPAVGATGATGASGASGATGAKGRKQKKKSKSSH